MSKSHPITEREKNRETSRHPAFGTITLTQSVGAEETLFGSEIKHGRQIRIAISTARLVRNLSSDWIHPEARIIDIAMSQAQFAQFITSVGNGDGTPVTIKWLKDAGAIPGIEMEENKLEIHRREIVETVKESAQEMSNLVNRLGAMIDDGRLSKKELKEIQHSLRCLTDNLPSNMAFSVKMAEESLEKVVSAAKIEVESYIQMVSPRLTGQNSIINASQPASTGFLEATDSSTKDGEIE